MVPKGIKMVKAKIFILAKHFDGYPKETDLKLIEEELPPIKNGGKYLYKTINIYVLF